MRRVLAEMLTAGLIGAAVAALLVAAFDEWGDRMCAERHFFSGERSLPVRAEGEMNGKPSLEVLLSIKSRMEILRREISLLNSRLVEHRTIIDQKLMAGGGFMPEEAHAKIGLVREEIRLCQLELDVCDSYFQKQSAL